jgi:NAD(P)-dependent dehydrogenase (short-subunit alcohol dehydrogenase family)
MNLRLHDKVALVTGATRGIGKAVALAYGREGARVGVTYASDRSAAEAVVATIARAGGAAHAVHLELTDPASVAAAIDATVERFGGLDVLVANAVRWPQDARGTLTDARPEAWSNAMRANLEGTVATVRGAMGHLARSSAGRVVLISSGLSRAGMAGATSYAAAKAGLDGLVAALKWEAGEHGVLVNIVSPGFTVTENNLARFGDSVRESVRARTPSRRLSVPEDVAAAVLLLGSPANGNITGAYLPVAGGID